MKQKLIDGDEYDCVSKWRTRGILGRRPGVWKRIKRKMNRRHRAESRRELKRRVAGGTID